MIFCLFFVLGFVFGSFIMWRYLERRTLMFFDILNVCEGLILSKDQIDLKDSLVKEMCGSLSKSKNFQEDLMQMRKIKELNGKI